MPKRLPLNRTFSPVLIDISDSLPQRLFTRLCFLFLLFFAYLLVSAVILENTHVLGGDASSQRLGPGLGGAAESNNALQQGGHHRVSHGGGLCARIVPGG